jgi:hypothetical protein
MVNLTKSIVIAALVEKIFAYMNDIHEAETLLANLKARLEA